jgi:hypothetical protein
MVDIKEEGEAIHTLFVCEFTALLTHQFRRQAQSRRRSLLSRRI